MVRERDGNLDRLVQELSTRTRNGDRQHRANAEILLGHLFRQDSQPAQSLTHFRAASALAPESPSAARGLGESLRALGQSTEASTAFETALRLSHTNDSRAEILRALIDLALSRGDASLARTWHRQLVGIFPSSASVRRELADALVSRQSWPEAVTELQNLARALAGDNRVLPAVLRSLGRAQLQSGHTDEALATFRRALSLSGTDGTVTRELYDDLTEVYRRRNELPLWITSLERNRSNGHALQMLLGRLHAEEGHTDQAIASYRRAVASRPTDIDAHIALIQLLTQTARLDELIAARRALIAAAPHNPTYVTDLAEELSRRGRRTEALQLLHRASMRAGRDAETHERLAQVYARLGENTLALRETALVATFDPADPAALEALGERLLEAGQRDRALATWARIRDTANDRARGLRTLAEVYSRHDMPNEAVTAYRESLALRDTDVMAHEGLAVLQEQSRDFAGAEASWRRVIALAPTDPSLRREARSRLVNLWNVQGTLAERVTELDAAFRREPPDLEAGRDLAEAYSRLRRPAEATAVLERLVSLAPGDVSTLTTLERVRTQNGDLAGAMAVLERLVEADPRNVREWYDRLARHALALHRDADAVRWAARAVQSNPDDARGHQRLGELYRAREDFSQAIAAFRRALALNDRLFTVYFELADLYLARNEAREAIGLYQQVVRLSPDDEWVARAGRMAIEISVATGNTDVIEGELVTASARAPGRVILRRLAVEFYAAVCRPLIDTVRNGDPEHAREARRNLQNHGARALKPLLDALGDDDPGQRDVALDLLGYLANANAAPALLTLAENTEAELTMRRRALRAAAAVADRRVLPRLVAFERGNETTLATLATWGISRLGTTGVSALVWALGSRAHPDVRAMAALGLTANRSGTVRNALVRALDDDSVVVGACAALALGPGADNQTVNRLRERVSRDPWTRAAALTAIAVSGRANNEDVVSATRVLFSPVSVIAGGEAMPLRRVAARALVRMNSGPEGRALAGVATLEDVYAPWSPLSALRAMIDPPGETVDGVAVLERWQREITDGLRAALGVVEAQPTALEAIETIGCFEPLVTSTPTERETVDRVERARRAMLDAVSPALAVIATGSDPDRRSRALTLLAESHTNEARETLVRAIGDSDTQRRDAALRAVSSGTALRADAVDSLGARVTADNPWPTRLAATMALARVEGTRARDVLTTVLRSDVYAWVRRAAATALRERESDPLVRAALDRAAANDPDPSVRSAARP